MSCKKLLYTPSGRAGAYANSGWAANIFKGCTHNCRYCYVPGFLHMDAAGRRAFEAAVTPAPEVLVRVAADVKRLGKLAEPVFLCFTCDSYPADEGMREYTRKVIEIIMESGNAVNILSKGGLRLCRDFELLASESRNKVGATLTFADEALSREWEPGAALPLERLEMLRKAKEHGISTWASIEPVIVPSESLAIMELALPYVDEFKIGKWNHDTAAGAIDWHKFAADAVALMERSGKRYMVKDDLKKYL